jgi:large subunit ribosomal protein L21
MEAIIQTGGKQLRISPGDIVEVEKLDAAEGDIITLDQVIYAKDGDKIMVGKPLVENAAVKAKVLAQDRGKKIIVFKLKRRKDYRRKNGHRQSFTRLKIQEITVQ